MKRSYIYILLCGLVGLSGCHNGKQINDVQTLQFDRVISASKNKLSLQSQVISGTNLNDVASNGSVYVAIGDKSQILYSLDGNSWDNVVVDTQDNLHAVSYNEVTKLFYAVGDHGLILSSPDGLLWSKYRQLQPPRNLFAVYVVKGDTFVGAESGGVFEIETSSPRGIIALRDLDDSLQSNVVAISSNDAGTMVVATDKGAMFYKNYAQLKINNWTKVVNRANLSFSDLEYDGTDGALIATSLDGNVLRSYNGIQWSTPVKAVVSEDKDFAIKSISVEPNSNKFLLAGGDYNDSFISSSNDFNFWDTLSYGDIGIFNKVKCFSREFGCLAVGESGVIMHSSYSAEQGVQWSRVIYNNSIVKVDIAYESDVEKSNYINFSAVATLRDGESIDYSSYLVPSSDNLSVIDVQQGKIFAKNAGHANILFKSTGSGITYTRPVQVRDFSIGVAEPQAGTLDYARDSLQLIPVGDTGLKTYVLTNQTNRNLILNTVELPNNNFITLSKKTTCYDFDTKGNIIFKPIVSGASCKVVYQYQPKLLESANVFDLKTSFKDESSLLSYTNSAKQVPYSSRVK